MKVLIPKTYVEIDPDYGPLFFLAGPVRGGGDWQKDAVEEILKHLGRFYVAIPYYYNTQDDYPLMCMCEKGKEDHFARQLNWERYYIDLAQQQGCLIFWLPEEDTTNPRLPEEGPYASDTRGEIARASVELKYNPGNRLVVGAEPKFPGLSQMQRNFSLDQGLQGDAKWPFCASLEETVALAVRKVMSGTKVDQVG